MSSSENNVALVREFYRQLSAGDLDAVQSRLHATFVLRATDSLPYGGRREGVNALGESMQEFLRHWTEPQFDVREFHDVVLKNGALPWRCWIGMWTSGSSR